MISIPLKDMECSVINIFDTETGEDLGQIDDVKSVKMTSEYKTDYAQKMQRIFYLLIMILHIQ